MTTTSNYEYSTACIEDNLNVLRDHLKNPKDIQYFDRIKSQITNITTYKELDNVNRKVFWYFINNYIDAHTYSGLIDSLERIKMNLVR